MPEFTVTVKPKGLADAQPFTVTVSGNVHQSQQEAERHVAATSGRRLVVVPQDAPPASDGEGK